MKNRIVILCVMLISCFALSLNVNAEATNAVSGDDNFTELKAQYDKGLQTARVTGSEWVTLYGKSECNGSGCTVAYAGQYSKFEDVLSRSVVCSNGEKYITYQSGSSGRTPYATNNEAKLNGTAYWSEEYYVTCSNTNTGTDTTITLNNSTSGGSTGSTGGSSTGDSIGGSSTGSTGTGDSFNSSTTVDNEQTGVETYFIVLGLVAIISYVGMVFVKKFNLFKNI